MDEPVDGFLVNLLASSLFAVGCMAWHVVRTYPLIFGITWLIDTILLGYPCWNKHLCYRHVGFPTYRTSRRNQLCSK